MRDASALKATSQNPMNTRFSASQAKRLGLDLGLRYWKRRAQNDKSDNHTITKLELYALAADSSVLDALK